MSAVAPVMPLPAKHWWWCCCDDDPKGPFPCPEIEECLALPDAFRVTILEAVLWTGDIPFAREYYRFEHVEHLIHRTGPNNCGWLWVDHDIMINSALDEECNFDGSENGQWYTRLTCEQGFWLLKFSPGNGAFGSRQVCFEMANQNNSPLGTYTAINTGLGDCRSFDTGHKCESEGSVVITEV